MTRCKPYLGWRVFGTAGALGIMWMVSGCGFGGPEVCPVTGRVTVDGETLRAKSGNVAFLPDKAKGNNTTLQPIGYLDEEGNYTLYYEKGKKGAPPGWYKVQVAASQQGERARRYRCPSPRASPRPRPSRCSTRSPPAVRLPG